MTCHKASDEKALQKVPLSTNGCQRIIQLYSRRRAIKKYVSEMQQMFDLWSSGVLGLNFQSQLSGESGERRGPFECP